MGKSRIVPLVGKVLFISNPDMTRFVSQSEQLNRFFFKRYPKAVEKLRDTLNWQSNSGLIKDN